MSAPAIPFTQYLLPNGRQQAVSLPCSAEVAALAGQIIAAGFVFEIEVLRTGAVSATIVDRDIGDFDIVVTENGPPLHAAIERMVRAFDHGRVAQWRRRYG